MEAGNMPQDKLMKEMIEANKKIKVAAVASGYPISASSEFDPDHSINRAIINCNKFRTGPTAWGASFCDQNQWVQVCLIKPKIVTGVALQGRANEDQWVTWYKVMYSIDGINWFYHESGKEYQGCYDRQTVIQHDFETPFKARSVRIVPTKWHGHVSTCFEVYFID
ncbi:galactose-binding domain-containing protein [Stylonychia lemnae]|uniref:Galactose-binding domain-containing protein n=1 Tax=Stylonychia lemnae TaxID=5949 RepID=A0A078B1N0_STYLE|nr:galactose-binding domain-containing protein [Stylonychia lemnae]|eukprot:CDW88399.1 galactose-binding domain-containing protein [Stylonychia lemnae]